MVVHPVRSSSYFRPERLGALLLAIVVLSGSSIRNDYDRMAVLDPALRSALVSPFAAAALGADPGRNSRLPCFIEGDVSDEQLDAHSVLTGAHVGNRVTARIPISELEMVAALPGIHRIRAAHRLQPLLDLSIPDTRMQMIRVGLPDTAQGLMGRNVLIGVIDTGIDWTHSDFKETTGATRIDGLWDQSDSVGPPPSGYSYGSAWTSTQIDLGQCREVDNTVYGHGTHVTGIAAGNGRGTGNSRPAFTYVGMAPKARIEAVRTTYYDTDILDGAQWIFARAAALGLPAVINLSLGNDGGPHDGTSDFELMLNGLSGPGRIIVASCGNSNGKGSHGERIVPVTGEGLLSFRVFAYTPSPTVSEGVMLDGWYQGGDDISVTVRSPLGTLVGPVAKGNLVTVTTPEGTVSIDQSGVEGFNTNGDVEVTIELSDAGGIPVSSGDWEIHMTAAARPNGGEVDFWVDHHSFPNAPAFVNGREEAELVAAPSTADSLISVAAHTTRSSWQAINGYTYNYGQTLNQIATFSSLGPRRDGVMKPDLSAPGTAVGSSHSVNSLPNPTSNILPDGVHKILQGTSMSAPHVAGAVAVMLEKWPWLSAAQAKSALVSTARADAITGVVPNATWGYGRLDMQRLFQGRLGFTATADPARFAAAGSRIYLLGLCAVPQAGSWSTRYYARVRDSSGWLRHLNNGTPVPGTWTETTPPAASGQPSCVPSTGDLVIDVPPTAHDGDNTVVTFDIEPERLSFMKQTVTTTITVGSISAVPDGSAPKALALSVAAASPGSPYVFTIDVPRSGPVELMLLDVQGRHCATLWNGNAAAGTREVKWNGSDSAGRRVRPGVYFARLVEGRETRSRSVVVTW